MFDKWLRECQVALLCFDISAKKALRGCVVQFEQMLRVWDPTGDHFGRNACLLVGCKMDLMYPHKGTHDIMQENYRMARKLSDHWNVPFVEPSAKERVNVD